MNRLGQNLSLIVISLLLAFLSWIVATESEDPTKEGPFAFSLPLEVRGLEPGVEAYDYESTRVRLELRAPQSIWRELDNENVRAFVDVSNGATGTLTLPVHIDVPVQPVQVMKVTPAEVTINVDPIAERLISVTVKTEGTPLFGYRAGEAEVVPAAVRVRGPATWVARVQSAEITVSIQGQQSDVRSDYQPAILDQEGSTVPYLEIIPKNVTVNVPIEQLGYVRDLAVTVPLPGQPAPGYRLANVVVEPPVVKVFGPTDVVRNAPPYLQTQPINLEAITRSLTTTMNLQMLDNLSIIYPPQPYVTVSLTIEAIRSGLNLNVEPEIRGLNPELVAEVGIESVVVILSGPLTVMEELDVDKVQLILDLTNLMPGDYTIIPKVEVPAQVAIENIIPEAVPVTIEEFEPVFNPFE